jgi:hypothetical protein
MNDVRTISTYAPYVDLMFLDRECATLSAEKPLCDDLVCKAKIFSMTDLLAFISYLNELDGQVDSNVRKYAKRICGSAAE